MWGVFMPLYALHANDSWGAGDFSELEALINWVAPMGGEVIATLPLLPVFVNNPSDASPYLPVSRQLWNEFYLDVSQVPELQSCPTARSIIESAQFQEDIKTLRGSSLVDYRHQMILKRQVLEELCKRVFSKPSRRLEALCSFAEANPMVEDYARFRATHERQNASWRLWPQPLRDGVLKDTDYNEENRRYHLYVQWLNYYLLENGS